MARKRVVVVWLLAAMSAACAARESNAPGIADISRSLEERSGFALSDANTSTVELPPNVSLVDGLTEEEAVAVALWNHAGFKADLATLGFSRADVAEAGLLRNPILTLLLPLGPKQFEGYLFWPLEALWQRPRRVAAAQLDAGRMAQNLVEHGLNLVRDARFAHIDAVLAVDRLALAREQLTVRSQILEITEARLRAGDSSEIETQPARNDVRVAEGERLRLEHEATAASSRLSLILGRILETLPPDPVASSLPARMPPSLEALFTEASASRPEMRASEIAIEAAGARARWQKSRIFALTAILDANGRGEEGFEMGPGIQAELFTADRNSGARLRAVAELEQASRQYVAARQQIAAEVAGARIRYQAALEAVAEWRDRILPPLEETARRAERAFAAGDVSRFFVLENTARLLQARNQYIEIQWSLRRAHAELERGLGRRIDLS